MNNKKLYMITIEVDGGYTMDLVFRSFEITCDNLKVIQSAKFKHTIIADTITLTVENLYSVEQWNTNKNDWNMIYFNKN